MTDGFKLSELTALVGAMASTDRIYLVRGADSLRGLVSQLRITASQVSNSTTVGQALMTAANQAAGRSALGLGALAVLATVGTGQIDNVSVTLAKLADLAQDRIIIGDATNRPIAFALSDLGKSLLQITPATDVADAGDDESSAYTGIDNAQVGSVYAQLTDLNALRAAYEDVRTTYNDLLTQIRSLGLIA